jgi:hypothetical protein
MEEEGIDLADMKPQFLSTELEQKATLLNLDTFYCLTVEQLLNNASSRFMAASVFFRHVSNVVLHCSCNV